MAEDRQPADIVEGATSGDVEDEVQPTAKSAEDRKAAAALSKLDARGDDEGASREVDQEAVNNAMSSLGGGAAKKEVKTVKVDAADVKLLVSPVPTFSLWRWYQEFVRISNAKPGTGRRTRATQAQGHRAAQSTRRRCGEGLEGLPPTKLLDDGTGICSNEAPIPTCMAAPLRCETKKRTVSGRRMLSSDAAVSFPV